jgi:hypothetical protein
LSARCRVNTWPHIARKSAANCGSELSAFSNSSLKA